MALKIMLAGYMFIYLCRLFEEYPWLGELRLERLWMLGLIAAFALQRPVLDRPWPGKLILFLPMAAVLLSGLGTDYGDSWAFVAENLFKVMVFCVILALSIKDGREFRWLIVTYVAVMFLYEFKSALEFLRGRHIYRMGVVRMVGIGNLYSDPNAFASNIIFTIPFAFALMRDKALASAWFRRALPLAFILLGIFCVVMSGSRAGLLTLAFVLLCQLMSARKGRLKILLAFLLAAFVAWQVMPDDKKERFTNLFKDEDEIESVHISARQNEWAKASAESRKQGFLDGWALLLRKPVLGHGAGSFSLARGLVGQDEGLQAHNLLGQVMGDMGLAGLATLVAMVWFLLKRNLITLRTNASLKPYAFAVILTTLAMLLSGYGAHNFYRYNWYWLIAFTSILIRLSPEACAVRAPDGPTLKNPADRGHEVKVMAAQPGGRP